MTYVASLRTFLAGDTTLMSLLTGGIYDYHARIRVGGDINRETTPAAFDAVTGLLKPICVLKAREANVLPLMIDEGAQYTAMQQVIEAYFYADQSYSVIEQARDRVRTLINYKVIEGIGHFRLKIVVENGRDPTLGWFLRDDYTLTSKIK